VTYKRKLTLSVLLAVAGYGAWVVATQVEEVMASAARVGVATLAIICALSLLNYLLRFGRWDWYLGFMGHRLPLASNLRIYLAGFALTTTPGKAGEAIRSLFLKEQQVPYADSLAALAVERLTDLISVALIATAGMVLFPQYHWLALLVLLIAVAMIVSIQSRTLRGLLHRLLQHTLPKKIKHTADHAISLLDRASDLLGTQGLLVGVSLGVIAWSAEAYGFWYLVRALGYELPFLLAAAVYALSMLAGAASFMPGGLGGAEAAMGFMLLTLGLSGPDAVSATLICRIATLWLAVVIGLVALSAQSSASGQALDDATNAKQQ
jgi:uncharacterized protein (TIRG00374 family)